MDLSEFSVQRFVETVASDSPAPGGGSVAALEASLGAALTAMVANLTQGRKKYAEFAEHAAAVETESRALQNRLLFLMEEDSKAFNLVSEAFKLPKDTKEQQVARSAAIQEGLKACTRSPMEMMTLCAETISLAVDFLDHGFNTSSASDLGVAFLSLKSAMQGAWLNVLINLSSIKDQSFVSEYRDRGEQLLRRFLPLADTYHGKILDLILGFPCHILIVFQLFP